MIKEIANRATKKFSWRQPRQRLAKNLNRFSQAEAETAWQMVQAFNASDDPSHKARLFRQALEELDHAAICSKLARKYSDFPLPLAAQRREPLQGIEDRAAGFRACVLPGEAGAQDMTALSASVSPLVDIREVFVRRRGNRSEHLILAESEIHKIARSKPKPPRTNGRGRLKRIYDAWMRFSHAIGDFMFAFWLSVIYFLSGPVFGWLCKRRMDKLQ